MNTVMVAQEIVDDKLELVVFDKFGDGIHDRKAYNINKPAIDEIVNSLEKGTSHKVFVKTCVNQSGKVTYVELMESDTSLKTPTTLKKVLKIVYAFKFEESNKQECGIVQFNLNRSL